MISVGILGGGAAGFFGAIQISQLAPEKVKVTILEKGSEPLSKVKISGGGRCNVTHNLFDPVLLSQKYPRGSKELRAAFERFQPEDTIAWFQERGVSLKAEPDGRMFPTTNKSSTIIDCFLKEASFSNVTVLLNTPIQSIKINNSAPFVLVDQNQKEYHFDKLLVSTGSNRKVWDWLQELGHTIEEPVPSLFSLNIHNDSLKELPGLSVPEAEIKIHPKGKPQFGPILITHWGLSGPAVLRLSAWEARYFAECDYKTLIQINWLGKTTPEEFYNQLQDTKKKFPTKKLASTTYNFPSRMWEFFVNSANVNGNKNWSEVSNSEIHRLKEQVTHCILEVDGKGAFKDEFVTCGGINRKEVDFRTMESKVIPNLFFAGEVLDIDGITGGFNFQNAWTTAFIASEGICNSIIKT